MLAKTKEYQRYIKRFLGFAGFYMRFVKDFAHIVNPLVYPSVEISREEAEIQAEEALNYLKMGGP